MEYEKLTKLFYKKGEQFAEEEYKKRINSYGSYLTPLSVQGFRKGKLTQCHHSLFYVNIPYLMQLNNKVLKNSSRISSLIAKLPQYILEPYFHKMIVNEAQSNNEIEGIRSTKKELESVLEGVNRSENLNKRFTGLMKTYLFIDDIEPFKTVRDFRELYDDLVSKEIDNSNEPDGRLFRKGYVEVNNGLSITHIGVSTEDKIIECLNTLITYLEDDEHPELYRYMVAHYFYEYVHPFYDGNGRTGRLLVCSYLSRYLERYSAITFSYAVNKNKNKYYKALEGVPNPLNKGELTFYLMDMLELLSIGQEEIIEDLEISLGKRERIAKFFNEDFVESSRDKWLILKFMVDISVFVNNDANISITKLMDAVNITRYKVDKIVSELESEGYIEQVSLRPKAFKVNEGFLENTLRV
ncbi:Fic family protein [Bacillus safensis]|uniref:Fic family protein n=1 Tax=Bacillus safensis TaxID=561879 RepID=UPI001246291C|nr:Fic family protein [Bacillus safensis]WBL28079.1 hypothetical protein ORQ91_00625 [Bacillus safensis]